MKAIETQYKGYRFRSRLEARWAVWMDTLGIEWKYEPEGFEFPDGTRYLPDFWIPAPDVAGKISRKSGYWLEIKGTKPTPEEIHKGALLTRNTGHTTLIFWGSPCEEHFHTVQITALRGYFDDGKFDVRKPAKLESEHFGHTHHLQASRFVWGQNKYLTHDDADRAMRSARSARFEFGECPA